MKTFTFMSNEPRTVVVKARDEWTARDLAMVELWGEPKPLKQPLNGRTEQPWRRPYSGHGLMLVK